MIQDENLDAVSSASINLVDDQVVGNMKILDDYILEKPEEFIFNPNRGIIFMGLR